MPLLPRTYPLFKTRARRVGFYATTLFTAAAIFDYNNYNVLSRSLRSIRGGVYIVYLYKFTTPKDLAELNELHAEAARTVRDICLTNEGLYIKLGQLITSMNSAVPPIVIDILKVLLDDAPKVDVEVVKKILEKELRDAHLNQERWMAGQESRLAEREALRISMKSTAKDDSAKIPELSLYNNLVKHHAEIKQKKEKLATQNGNNATEDAEKSSARLAAAVTPAAEDASSSASAVPPTLAPYFLAFDEEPVASASIAQVHKATIIDPQTGLPIDVAVKILKPQIRRQIWYDCACHSLLTHTIEKLFNIPITHNNATVDRNLSRESDFYVEAAHTDLLRDCFAATTTTMNGAKEGTVSANPHFRKDVMIPRIFYEYLTDTVMVTEWVDAVKLSETKKLDTEIFAKGIASKKSMMTSLINAFSEMVFVHGAVNCDPHPANLMIRPHPQHRETIKARQRELKEAIVAEEKKLSSLSLASNSGVDVAVGRASEAASSLHKARIDLLSAQLKALPSVDVRAPRHQLVLLDHGLCVTITTTFRYEFALFFRSLLGRDLNDITRLVRRWGVADTELFIAMTLQKPFEAKSQPSIEAGDGSEKTRRKDKTNTSVFFDNKVNVPGRKYTREELAAMQQMLKDRLSKFLSDEELMPKEMLFVGRSFNYLRGINKSFGAPINRVQLTSDCAFAVLDKVRIETLDDLELWEDAEHCDRNQQRYLSRRKQLHLDDFSSELRFYRKQLAVKTTLFFIEMYHVVTLFVNTVIVPVIALGDEKRARKLRLGSMEEVLEEREAHMSERLWGPNATKTTTSVEMDFVPDVGVND